MAFGLIFTSPARRARALSIGGLARYSVHLAASTVPFWNVAKQPKNGSNGGISVVTWTHRTGILQKNWPGMHDFMHACIYYRLNQRGKSSYREVYHDHENHDYDYEHSLLPNHVLDTIPTQHKQFKDQ